jgi:hypothetical protein
MRPLRRSSTPFALLAALALSPPALLAGCGGGGGSGGGGGGGPPPPAPDPAVVPTGTPLTWGPYQVVVPDTMSIIQNSDAVALDKGTSCRITLWQPMADQGDLDSQALAFMKAIFSDPRYWSGVVGEMASTPLDETYHQTGITGQGLPFVEMRGVLLNTGGGRTNEHVRVMMVDLGGQVAAMLGWANTPGCLDEASNPFEWVMLAYSLTFPDVAGDNAALGRKLVGGWFGANTATSMAWSDVFAANGQHSDLYGIETYHQISPTEILETFSTWQGNGLWGATGNLLTLWPGGSATGAKTMYFRIYTEARSNFTFLRKLDWCTSRYCEGWETKE